MSELLQMLCLQSAKGAKHESTSWLHKYKLIFCGSLFSHLHHILSAKFSLRMTSVGSLQDGYLGMNPKTLRPHSVPAGPLYAFLL